MGHSSISNYKICFWGFWGLLLGLFLFCARSCLSCILCWKGVYRVDNKWLTKWGQEQLITPHHHFKTPAAVQRIGSSTATWKKQLRKSLDEGWHPYSTRMWRETSSWLERNTGFHRNLGDVGELALIFWCSKLISYTFLEAKNYKEPPEIPEMQGVRLRHWISGSAVVFMWLMSKLLGWKQYNGSTPVTFSSHPQRMVQMTTFYHLNRCHYISLSLLWPCYRQPHEGIDHHWW